jgi:vacuolar-type H+-ATPase subunit D/Vma8
MNLTLFQGRHAAAKKVYELLKQKSDALKVDILILYFRKSL